MSANFGSGESVSKYVALVAATNPAFWLDCVLGALTPGTGVQGEAESALADYNYAGRNLGTNPLHNASQGTGARQPTFNELANGRGSLAFNVTQNFGIATAFGAATSHTFSFCYNPASLAAASEVLFTSTGPQTFLIATKLSNAGGVGTTLCMYDGLHFTTLGNLLAGLHSYIVTLDGPGTTASVYVDRNPVAYATGLYAPKAMSAVNTFGSNEVNAIGLNGVCPDLIYNASVLTAQQIASVAKYHNLQFGTP